MFQVKPLCLRQTSHLVPTFRNIRRNKPWEIWKWYVEHILSVLLRWLDGWLKLSSFRIFLLSVRPFPYSSVSTLLPLLFCQYAPAPTLLSVCSCPYPSVSTLLPLPFCQYASAPTLLHDQHLCHGLMRNYCIHSHGLASRKNIRKFPLNLGGVYS